MRSFFAAITGVAPIKIARLVATRFISSVRPSVGWSVSQSVSQPVYWQRQVKKGSSLIIVPFIIMISAYFQVC